MACKSSFQQAKEASMYPDSECFTQDNGSTSSRLGSGTKDINLPSPGDVGNRAKPVATLDFTGVHAWANIAIEDAMFVPRMLKNGQYTTVVLTCGRGIHDLELPDGLWNVSLPIWRFCGNLGTTRYIWTEVARGEGHQEAGKHLRIGCIGVG